MIAVALLAMASFACVRPVTAAERAICADPVLAGADRRMATAYRHALAALSPAGAATLQSEHRRFVAWHERACRPGGLAFVGAGDGKPQTLGHCLLLAWQGRAGALDAAVTAGGGRRFLALLTTRAKHVACDDCTNFPAVRQQDVALVRIDGPQAPAEQAWNREIGRRVARWLVDPPYRFEDSDGAGNAAIEVEVASASPELISAVIGVSSYCAGAAHPNYSSETIAWSLRLGRALTAADLFRNPRAPALRQLVYAHLDTGGSGGPNGCDAPTIATSKFTLDRAGVTFRYDPYELGGYPCGGDRMVSWAALRPFLRMLPFDPMRLEVPRAVVGARAAR